MSNKQNDILIENTEEFVREMMANNPTIPDCAFSTLVNEEIACKMEFEYDAWREDGGWQPDTHYEDKGYDLKTGEY